MTVLIAGGGIAGLTAALSLHQIGIECRVFETVSSPRPLGVGINVLPHAVRELTELGLLDELVETGIPTAELAYYNKHGQRIWSEARGQDAGYRWPQFSIHRGELQLILLAAARERLGAHNILTGYHLNGWDETATGVRARFTDKRTGRRLPDEDGEVLIGADGIHSVVRSTLYPKEGAPIWNGAILWRGTTRAAPYLTGRSMIMAGHEFQKFVAYPISRFAADRGDAVINWIAERKFRPDHSWRREDWNRPGELADFLPQFADWRFDWLDVPSIIEAADQCFEYPMVDRDPLPHWTFGRVTLLGDAAHAMYPIGSNGASQGILDARVLAREIRRAGPTPKALEAYEAERRPATSKIVLANRANGPEQVMQLVEQRAPNGFARIEDVLTPAELEGTAANYKRLAGFDKDALNAREPIV
ncbi:MAG TPA: flavin-dependent oxidoreductase [Acetobacteraceae bacterium]|jgi:5-methylphenazine-1-carboxylate 1-monooxygenase|nr:flavin-dependent oxidoreductase [Acetobacteraceae bacterium]